MRNFKTISIIIVFVFLTQCSNDQSDDQNTGVIYIDLNQSNKNSIDEIYSKINVIPLQTKKESLVKNVNKLIFNNNRYYILDRDQKCIFIFNQSGDFLNIIYKYGNGPGEYREITDFEINQFSNNIEILSPQGTVNIYDLNGTFINKYTLPIRVRAVHYFKNISSDVVAFYSISEQKNIILYSKRNEEIITTFFEAPQVIRFTPLQTTESPFTAFEDKILFYQGFTNDVFELNEKGLKKRYSWDFKSYNINIENIPQNLEIPIFFNYLMSSNFVHSFIYNFENSDYVFTKFLCGKTFYNLIFNKKQQSYNLNSRINEEIAPLPIISLDGNRIISVIEPAFISKYLKNELFDLKNQNKLDKIKETDNPIVLTYYLKGVLDKD